MKRLIVIGILSILVLSLIPIFGTMPTEEAHAQQDCEAWFFDFRSQYDNAGCADDVIISNARGADFEGGRAYLYEASGNFGAPLIYVIYNDRTWEVFAVQSGNPPTNAVPPANLYAPTGEIGVLWNNNAMVRERLGWAYSPITSFVGRRQLPLVQPSNTFDLYIDHGAREVVLRLRQDFLTGSRSWVVAGNTSTTVSNPPPATATPIPSTPSGNAIGTLTPFFGYEINVREGAGTNFPVVQIIDWRDTVPLISVGNNWHQIELDGRVLYVTARYTEYELFPETATPEPAIELLNGMAFSMINNDASLAAVAVDTLNDEAMAIIGSRNGDQIQQLRGGVWIGPDGRTITVTFNRDGYPSVMQMGDETYVFRNYQPDSVEVVVILPNNDLVIISAIPINASSFNQIDGLVAQYVSDPQAGLTSNSQVPALLAFQLMGYAMNDFVCRVAVTSFLRLGNVTLNINDALNTCGGFSLRANTVINPNVIAIQDQYLTGGQNFMRNNSCLQSHLQIVDREGSQAIQAEYNAICQTTAIRATRRLVNDTLQDINTRQQQIQSLQSQ